MGSKRLYRFATLFRMAVTRQMTRDDAAQILEVPPSASNDEVMSAWKRMAIQWHPDRNSDPQATSIMAKINMARDLMTGRQWRVMFDDGQTEPPPRPARSPGQDFWGDMWGAWPGGPGWDEDEEEPEESPAGGQYYTKHQNIIDEAFENPTIDGNENWGSHEIGAKTPAEWGPLVKRSAERMLAADSPDAFNDIDHPNRVVPQQKQLAFNKGVTNLPPHSLTIVRVRGVARTP